LRTLPEEVAKGGGRKHRRKSTLGAGEANDRLMPAVSGPCCSVCARDSDKASRLRQVRKSRLSDRRTEGAAEGLQATQMALRHCTIEPYTYQDRFPTWKVSTSLS